jgi:hypothetical protein
VTAEAKGCSSASTAAALTALDLGGYRHAEAFVEEAEQPAQVHNDAQIR